MLNKIKTLVLLLKKLQYLPDHERVASSSDLQKIVNFVDFKFSESKELSEISAMAAATGQALRRLLGYEELQINVLTEKPVAIDSLDHIHPWGTKQDNSKNLRFNKKIFAWMPMESLRVLDIGCSGGGFVRSMHDAGVLSVGLEGSDYSKIRARAEWGVIANRLFTADATAPFRIVDSHEANLQFSLITAWEFIEHIEEASLVQVFKNIDNHLCPNGVVIMSVSPTDDFVDGINLHRTVKPYEWWIAKCLTFGFRHHPEAVSYFSPDNWIRYEANAAQSFHLVLTRSTDVLPQLPE